MSSGSSSVRVPELSNATCADPPKGLPKYCCKGMVPDADYAGSCECNPGWSHQECMCKAHLVKMPCHQCMVHLPGTNRWTTAFTKTELYQNCEDCVTTCKTDLAAGECKDFMTDIWESKFPGSEPKTVLCTDDYLKKTVQQKEYPTELRRALYKAPRLHADPELYHQPSNWKVPGVGVSR